VRRLVLLFAIAFAIAGCGSSKMADSTTTAAPPPDPASAVAGGETIYHGGAWAVVVKGDTAVALHLAGGEWQPDHTGQVKVSFLGPRGTVASITQVAAELSAKSPLVESGLWVDGTELLVKGGGLTATRGTIYGAPSSALAKGKHLAVAYARTATAATAVARVFRVR
jgi:hypothetical protein